MTVAAGTVVDGTEESGASATIVDGLTLDGTAELGAFPNFGSLTFSGTQSLDGTGTVVLGDANLYFDATNSDSVALTIGAGITIDGGGLIVSVPGDSISIVNNGTIDADTPGGEINIAPFLGYPISLTNNGLLEATNDGFINADLTGASGPVSLAGSGSNMTLDGDYVLSQGVTAGAGTVLTLNGTWANQGTISTADATLNLGGAFTVGGLGELATSDATVNLTGTLINTDTTLALTTATGSWNLDGGTIQGGTISATGGAELVLTPYGGTLDSVTIAPGTEVDATQPSVQAPGDIATIMGGLTLDGTVALDTPVSGYAGGAFLYFSGTQTLGGTGSIVFRTGTPGSSYVFVQDASGPATLTIGSQVTIDGGNGYVDVDLDSADASIVNDGTVDANTPGATITVGDSGFAGSPSSQAFTNNGTLEATDGGTLSVVDLEGDAGSLNLSGEGSQLVRRQLCREPGDHGPGGHDTDAQRHLEQRGRRSARPIRR